MVFVGYYCCHSLRGLCGLKYFVIHVRELTRQSQPARAVWIEIVLISPYLMRLIGHSLRGLCGLKFDQRKQIAVSSRSQPARAVWIEIPCLLLFIFISFESQPARAVWIEILGKEARRNRPEVTACEGCVD